MFDSTIQCIIGLVIATAVFLWLVPRVSVELADGQVRKPPGWLIKLAESKIGIAAEVLLSLMLIVGIGGLVGVVVWEAIKGVAETVTNAPGIFTAALFGAAVSMIGFVLFTFLLSLFGPILSMAFERWTAHVAPAIGGAVGAAIWSGMAVNVILMVALSALTGGITLVLSELIFAKERPTAKGISDVVIAGVGIGAINGAIVAAVFKLLEATVGLSWLLSG